MLPDKLIDEVARMHAEQDRRYRSSLLSQLGDELGAFVEDSRNQEYVNALTPEKNYLRLLLNSPDDPFQVVLVMWGPGKGSPIHDHDGTVGVVSALTGRTREVKYEILHEGGSEVALAAGQDQLVVPGRVTTILPEDDMQLHLMVNEAETWSVTVHIYLDAIHNYRTYDKQSDGLYRASPLQLWFDQINVSDDMNTWRSREPARVAP
ncbi:hypothetical protein GCM10009676_24990 [Prauserella halophila]|uniref:Cysteine dioxygenase n=1 Tax=Prauserella halophila TaxID=185641 RepID=A0ABP4GX61_9PSEU|nr:cysteine dioxygenase family protein [Prauserella halophila]MCP2234883.1 Cysteine dioxygenase type I [Prauserella halophila]